MEIAGMDWEFTADNTLKAKGYGITCKLIYDDGIPKYEVYSELNKKRSVHEKLMYAMNTAKLHKMDADDIAKFERKKEAKMIPYPCDQWDYVSIHDTHEIAKRQVLDARTQFESFARDYVHNRVGEYHIADVTTNRAPTDISDSALRAAFKEGHYVANSDNVNDTIWRNGSIYPVRVMRDHLHTVYRAPFTFYGTKKVVWYLYHNELPAEMQTRAVAALLAIEFVDVARQGEVAVRALGRRRHFMEMLEYIPEGRPSLLRSDIDAIRDPVRSTTDLLMDFHQKTL